MRVKICGCRSVEHALVAAEAGADFIGMVFADSRRRIEVAEARDIVQALGQPLRELEMVAPPALYRFEGEGTGDWYRHGATALERLLERKRPLTVGVFANNEPEEINDIADEVGLDLIQLSGGEPWATCLLVNRQVIKVVHVSQADSVHTLSQRIEGGASSAVMLDKAASVALGGTGQSFDWQIASQLTESMPFWLAGGLTPVNVPQAIAAVHPWCVDVSSGVETDGVKDLAKIRAFVEAAKGS